MREDGNIPLDMRAPTQRGRTTRLLFVLPEYSYSFCRLCGEESEDSALLERERECESVCVCVREIERLRD